MKLQRYLMALLWAVVAIGFQISTLREHAAWNGERGTVMGHVDKVIIGRKIMETRYSFEVDGHNYTGEVVDAEGFLEDTPAMVTYAKSNPSVSTIVPSEIGKLYITSVIITILGLVPLVILFGMDVRSKYFPKKPKPAA